MAIIYCARCIKNGKLYIGQTKRTLEERRAEHELAAQRGEGFLLGKAIRKHGKANFGWNILENCVDEEANYLEQLYIDMFSSADKARGYNCTYGGEVFSVTAEVREKISRGNKGRVPWIKGKQHPAEVRARISAKVNAHVKEYGGPMRGKKHSAQSKARMSASRTGVKCPSRGHKYTEEEKRIMSEKSKGIPRGPRKDVIYTCVVCGKIEETRSSFAKLCPECKAKYKSRWWTLIIKYAEENPGKSIPDSLLSSSGRFLWGVTATQEFFDLIIQGAIVAVPYKICTECGKFEGCTIINRKNCGEFVFSAKTP